MDAKSSMGMARKAAAPNPSNDGRVVVDILAENPGLTLREIADRAKMTGVKVEREIQSLKITGVIRENRAPLGQPRFFLIS